MSETETTRINEETSMSWVKIPNHESYEINDHGEVRFLGCMVMCKDGRERYYPPRDCKPLFARSGYRVTCDGQSLSIAKLVATLFCDNPKGFKQFYHIDGNIRNNVSSNIKWGLRETVLFEEYIRHYLRKNTSKCIIQ